MPNPVLEAIDKIGDTVAAAHAKFNERFGNIQDRLEAIEAGRDRPKGTPLDGSEGDLTKKDVEHKSIFVEWIRKPTNSVYANRLQEAENELAKDSGRKDVTIGSNPGGGYGLPKQINSSIETRVRQLSPFRQLVDVQNASTNDYHSLVSMADATSGWVAETGPRSATASPTLRDRAPTFGELYSYPTASEWSLDDIFFDVQAWLTNDVAADFVSSEATAILSGNGTNKPTGIFNTTPTLAADYASPMRAAAAIQYVGLTSFVSPATINIDSLITLIHTVAERYTMEADKCAFVMHRLTVAILRRLKASTAGTYLWQDSIIAGQPPTLLGWPVYTCDAMPVVASDTFAVLFGNWYRSYLLVDRTQIRITPNPYSVPGQVSFYVRKRVGGCVKNNDALKALRISD